MIADEKKQMITDINITFKFKIINYDFRFLSRFIVFIGDHLHHLISDYLRRTE
jgi:hypothetical protein